MVQIQQECKQGLLVDATVVGVDVLRQVVEGFKDELDEHRDSINENSTEIESNFSYLCELDKKIEKLAERVDELCLFVKCSQEKKEVKISPLTSREKEVFLAFYVLGELKPFVTYRELARKLCVNESLIAGYIANLVEKGIPIVKKYDDNIAYIKLEESFRQRQAKENVVGVNTLLSYWL